ncbi:Na+/H+ antiporter NhaC [Halococcus sediminicola]|uniref:Na+/H+ antiporter NhaC n=1 Tax=Halococcus sediminicola TaxID=1264579 RepID=UPI0013778E52|nr:Na+/H+ antiporter NhaC [Halococcus sediminicola]
MAETNNPTSSQEDQITLESTPVTFAGAVTILAVTLLLLIVGSLVFDVDIAILLMLASMFTSTVYIYYYGFSWQEMLENGAIPMLSRAMGAFLILLIVGILIGTWMISGTIPYLMYIGLQVLSPSIFLVATAIILSAGALVTGTSYGAGATFGVALMGVAEGLGIPLAPTAGAVVMGAYFGDKLSPISDTTILASAIAEDDLIDHIRSMLYTTIPGYILGLGVFLVIGLQMGGGSVQSENISAILQALQQTFNLTPILLIPPLLLLGLSYLRYPTVPVLWVSIFAGVPFALFQGYGIAEIAQVMASGPEISTQVDALNELLTRGGVDFLAGVVSVLFFAYLFAGQLEYTRTFEIITSTIRDNFVGDDPGKLVFSTSITGLLTGLGTGNSYLSEIVPGIMYKDSYDNLGVSRSVLSRTLEDSGTVWVPLIPWSAAGLYFSSILGVPTLSYAPWAIMNYTGFMIAWIYAFTDTFIFDQGTMDGTISTDD